MVIINTGDPVIIVLWTTLSRSIVNYLRISRTNQSAAGNNKNNYCRKKKKKKKTSKKKMKTSCTPENAEGHMQL